MLNLKFQKPRDTLKTFRKKPFTIFGLVGVEKANSKGGGGTGKSCQQELASSEVSVNQTFQHAQPIRISFQMSINRAMSLWDSFTIKLIFGREQLRMCPKLQSKDGNYN